MAASNRKGGGGSSFGGFSPTATRIPYGGAVAGTLTDSGFFSVSVASQTCLGIGTPPDASYIIKSLGPADCINLAWAGGATSRAAWALLAGSVSTDFNAYNSSAGGTTFGIARASLSAIESNGQLAIGTSAAQSVKIATNNTVKLEVTSAGLVSIRTPSASAINVAGVVKTIQSSVGNVGGGEDDLNSTGISGGTLANAGEAVDLEFWFNFAANANNKTIKIYFGSTVIYDTGAVAQNGGAAIIRARIVRTGAATQRAMAWLVGASGYADDAQYTTPTETLSGTVTMKATGTATADNDIVNTMLLLNWIPGNN